MICTATFISHTLPEWKQGAVWSILRNGEVGNTRESSAISVTAARFDLPPTGQCRR